MIKWIIVLLLFLITPSMGQDLYPGSYRIDYGGYQKIIVRRVNRFLRRAWRHQINDRWKRGDINTNVWVQQHEWVTSHLIDYRDGPPWYTRAWLYSLESEDGGAPPNKSILISHGKDFLFFSTPFFSLTNTFGIQFRSLETSLDIESRRPIVVSGNAKTPRTGWKFKFSPEISVSASQILKDPPKTLRRVGCRISGVHTVRGKPIVGINGRMWYSPHSREFFIALQMYLLQW